MKHLDDVHSTTYVQGICYESGCLKYFTNAEALREHVQQNHSRICCEVCGSQQLKKQIKRHMRIHESQTCVERIKCHFDNCLHSFTRKSNLNQHIRAVHLGLRPFKCRFHECEMSFSHKAVRDNHEKTGRHYYVQGDFLEEDVAFQSRPRGGRKRKMFTINTLLKKRVACPDRSSTVLDNGSSFLDWLTSSSREWSLRLWKIKYIVLRPLANSPCNQIEVVKCRTTYEVYFKIFKWYQPHVLGARGKIKKKKKKGFVSKGPLDYHRE